MTTHVRPTKRAKISDRALGEIGERYVATKAEIKRLSDLAASDSQSVLSELDHRGLDEVIIKGRKLRKRQNVTRKVNLAEAGKLIGRGLFKRVTKTVIRTDAWNAAVASGLISTEVLDQCETESVNTPWLEVRDA